MPVLTRRGFLAASAALAGCATQKEGRAPFLHAQKRAPSPNLRVVVVGAGIAGLTAADAVRRQGADVVVLEADERVGGRVRTLRGFAGGQVAEGGGEFIDAGHTVMRG